MSQPVVLYDTTLRDGTQGENITLSLADKLRVARMLDEYGMPYIEGGWPGSNPKDIEFFAAARTMTWQHGAPGRLRLDPPSLEPARAGSQPARAGRGRDAGRHDLRQELAAPRDRGPGRHARPRTWTWSPTRSRFVAERGREVVYDAEHFFDGYAADRDYALATLRAARQAGARSIVLCDTNGGTLTDELVRVVPRHARPALDGDPGSAGRQLGHPHPQRRRARRGQHDRRGRGRRAPRPGHDQRLRRALRQRQHGQHPGQPGPQDRAGPRCLPAAAGWPA